MARDWGAHPHRRNGDCRIFLRTRSIGLREGGRVALSDSIRARPSAGPWVGSHVDRSSNSSRWQKCGLQCGKHWLDVCGPEWIIRVRHCGIALGGIAHRVPCFWQTNSRRNGSKGALRQNSGSIFPDGAGTPERRPENSSIQGAKCKRKVSQSFRVSKAVVVRVVAEAVTNRPNSCNVPRAVVCACAVRA